MIPNLISRAEWGARPARGRQDRNPGAQRGIAVHYSAGWPAQNHADCPGRVRGYQNYHMDTNGWADIGYSFLACIHGSVFEGRGWGVVTAAQQGNNSDFHAVCFIGLDTDRRDVTEEARAALASVILEQQRLYPDAKEVKPHSYFNSTSCPGDELRLMIQEQFWLPYRSKVPRHVGKDAVDWVKQEAWLAWRKERPPQSYFDAISAWKRERPLGVPAEVPKSWWPKQKEKK